MPEERSNYKLTCFLLHYKVKVHFYLGNENNLISVMKGGAACPLPIHLQNLHDGWRKISWLSIMVFYDYCYYRNYYQTGFVCFAMQLTPSDENSSRVNDSIKESFQVSEYPWYWSHVHGGVHLMSFNYLSELQNQSSIHAWSFCHLEVRCNKFEITRKNDQKLIVPLVYFCFCCLCFLSGPKNCYQDHVKILP